MERKGWLKSHPTMMITNFLPDLNLFQVASASEMKTGNFYNCHWEIIDFRYKIIMDLSGITLISASSYHIHLVSALRANSSDFLSIKLHAAT